MTPWPMNTPSSMRHAFADEGVAGDLAVAADDGVFLDLDECADARAGADAAAIEIDEVRMMDDDAFIQNTLAAIKAISPLREFGWRAPRSRLALSRDRCLRIATRKTDN